MTAEMTSESTDRTASADGYSTRLPVTKQLACLPDIDGKEYRQFVSGLAPNFGQVYRDMALILTMIALVPFAFLLIEPSTWTWVLIMPVAMWIGYWFHAYNTFNHEGAHFNVHKDRRTNDLVCAFLITPLSGIYVGDYRVTHWQHHIHLGVDGDTEISYRNPISTGQILMGLSGLRTVQSIVRYFLNFKSSDEGRSSKRRGAAFRFIASLFVFAFLQIAITAVGYFWISPTFAVSWAFGVFIVFPFFGVLRQQLEHRPIAEIDGELSETSLMFRDDFLSRFFGAAGFNRHLLHHVDPSISYTRFDDLERYLMSTSLADYIDVRRTSYAQRLAQHLRRA